MTDAQLSEQSQYDTGLFDAALKAHRTCEPLHSMIYFAPETEQQLVEVGLRPGRMCYFASRAAALGAVGPGVVTATFYNFSPELVARHIPRAWTLATPEAVVTARLRAVDLTWRRLLGAEVLDSAELAEAAALAREATTGASVEGRPLYAGHADLPWAEPAHLQLWQAITLLREHRGDGHLTTLVGHELNGVDAIVSHTATGRGFLATAAQQLRGWTDQEWADSIARLQARGILAEGDGSADMPELTEAGARMRAEIETETTELAQEPWQSLGMAKTARLIELVRPLTKLALTNGAFPAGVFATR